MNQRKGKAVAWQRKWPGRGTHAAMLMAVALLGGCKDAAGHLSNDSVAGTAVADVAAAGSANATPAQRAEAEALKQLGTLKDAPEAVCDGCGTSACGQASNAKSADGAVTGQCGLPKRNNACEARLTYGPEWAQRMPATFPVYPLATLKEAAGIMPPTATAMGSPAPTLRSAPTSVQPASVQAEGCNMRIVNFETPVRMRALLNYYHTRAVRAGFTSELVRRGDELFLGGTKGDDAFVVMVRDAKDGAVRDVDIVATGGTAGDWAAQTAGTNAR